MNNSCEIALILDRSGSMESIKTDTIGGFNKFLDSQKRVDGKCRISLYQFDDRYDVVYENKDIQDAPLLDDKTFVPRGWTALLDAIGRTVNDLGSRLNKLPEKERPQKVMVVIMTDGAENTSKEFSREKIFEMIKHQTDKYSWNFIFLGANQDAIATAQSYGIGANSTLTYAASSVGTKSAFNSLSTAMSGARCASTKMAFTFNQSDRDIQDKELSSTI